MLRKKGDNFYCSGVNGLRERGNGRVQLGLWLRNGVFVEGFADLGSGARELSDFQLR